MKQFCLSLFSIDVSAWLMTMFLLLMIMPSSIDGIKITLHADATLNENGFKITVEVQGSTTVKELKDQIKKEALLIQTMKKTFGIENPADGTVTVLQDSDTMAGNKIEEGAIMLVFVNFEITVKADEKIFNEQSPSATKTNTIKVEVNGTQKVKNFKQKIIEKMVEESKTKIGSDPKRLTLQYGTKDDFLNDEKIIYNYGIKNRAIGAIVRLSIGDFQIVVQEEIENGVKNYPIWVKSEETVAILKKKIKSLVEIEPEEQTLSWTLNGQTFDDNKTLKLNRIQNGTTITLSREFKIKVKADKKITNESYQITVVVQGSTTVKELKKRIKEASGIEPKRQSLQRENKDYEIEDENTLREYGIGKGTTIFMYIDKFKTVVKRNEKILYTFGMNRTDTVERLKEMIGHWYGYQVEKQTLKLKKPDGSVIELEDDKKLGFYGVESSLTIHLSLEKFKILVVYQKGDEAEKYTVWVKDMDTVATLKQKINKRSGIEVEGQALKLKNPNGRVTELEDSQTMTYYGIKEDTVILLSIKFVIKVRAGKIPMFSKTFTVEVNGWDTVKDLKGKIITDEKFKTKYGNDLKKMTLQHGPKDDYDILNDKKTINDYPIKKDDIVHLSIGEFEIDVEQYEKGKIVKTYKIWTNSKETVATLKKRIKNESEIKPDDQILKCNTNDGPALEDEKKLKDYGIGNGTTISLSTELFEVSVKYLPDGSWQEFKIMVKKTDTLATLKDKIRAGYTKAHYRKTRKLGTIQLVKKFIYNEQYVERDQVELWDKKDSDDANTIGTWGIIEEGSTVYVFHANFV
ncbi:hypothetical protein niasHT_004365 [Heterodera trifolii]|uniref:Ubiquitin-like domain-containing protein n=1 Tax=Heterodera trifolii TaxID=157864 RepID=A0ABD2MBB0_9BILA